MKINSFNNNTLDFIRAQFQEHMKEFEEKFGVKVDMGRQRYESRQFTSPVTFTVVADGEEDPEYAGLKHIFNQQCFRHGLSPEDWGKEFMHQGESYKIIGILPKSRKYTILTEKKSGGRTKFTRGLIQQKIGA